MTTHRLTVGDPAPPIALRPVPARRRPGRLPGSPTFHVGGADLFADGSPPALGCRLCTRPDGRFSPLPARDDLAARLKQALARPWDLPHWVDHRKGRTVA